MLRLSPSHQFYPRPILAVTDFRYPRLPWLDGRCVQGPGTYSPRHGLCAITSESSFTESSCRLRSELRRGFGFRALSPGGFPLSTPLEHVCRPGWRGRADLTSSPPSSQLTLAVPPESSALTVSNWRQGLRSLWHLSRHLTARADDNHAAPRRRLLPEVWFPRPSPCVQSRVRFLAYHRIKPHVPPLVRAPVNSF